METATPNNEPVNLSDPTQVAEAVRKNAGKPITVQIYFLQGIFGELDNCNGVAEEVVDSDEKLVKYGLDPKEGGTYIKLIGCSYLYKGNPMQSRVFGMEQAKDMVSMIPRDIIGRSFLYSAAIGLKFLFNRKGLIHDVHQYFNGIKHKTIRHVSPPWIRLKPSTREIRRAMDVALKREFKIDPMTDLMNESFAPRTDIEFAAAITKVVAFFTLIMEFDGAYYFPTMDALGEIDKENAARSGAREMVRIAQLMIDRNTNLTVVPDVSSRTEGVPNKFRFLKILLQIIFFFSPRARRLAKQFLLELDLTKVGLDEADWYFCLRRNTHNYRGVPLPDRLRELEQIDKLKGHSYVKIEFKEATQEQPKAEATIEPPKIP